MTIQERTYAAIIVAAGQGSRSGLDLPKQYLPLGGRAVLAHAYQALAAHPAIARILVVIGEGQEMMAREALACATLDPCLVRGGATRRESVRAALDLLAAEGGVSHVFIHDAARPFLPMAVIDRLLEATGEQEGAIPVLPVVDTLVHGEGEHGAHALMGGDVDREKLRRVQTPQLFHFETILRAHRGVAPEVAATDDAGMLRLIGVPVALVEGDSLLEKLTYAADFDRARQMLAANRLPRVGTGYDVHRLVEGKPLWLCGVEIAHSRGLSGHSDADVAIHALVDALLGALAEGDIGSHFPPSDPQWKGAASHRFLTFARDRVAARGGEIAHVDISIICEVPKIGPHRDAMRERLAALLEIDVSRVSVKATTTERLGFTGRREGIAAQAVATVLLPA